MELSPGAFNDFMGKMGHDFMWRRAFACPCFTPSSGAPRDACPLCAGKGQLWAAEVATRVGFTNQTARKGMSDFGVWEPGDCILSIGSDQPCYDVGHYDRFRSIRATHRFTDHLTRGKGDRLHGTFLSIDRVFWLDTDLVTIIEGGIPTVDANGVLTWASGAPPSGQTYSLAGIRYDEYFAYLQLPQDRPMHNGALLPRKLPARRFDLFGR